MPSIPTHLETERLLLRPAELRDAEAIYQSYASDPEVTRHLSWLPHASVQDTKEYLVRTLPEQSNITGRLWLMVRKTDEAMLGAIDIRIEGHQAIVGYCSAQDAWGKGYMTEAAKEVVAAVWKLPQIQRLWTTCAVGNEASARVIEKIGLVREGVLKKWMILPNVSDVAQDMVCYAAVRA